MDTELDHDDAVGRRMQSLRSWEPVGTDDGAWAGIDRRRHRQQARSRRVMVGVAVLVVALTSFAVVVSQPGNKKGQVSVVAPTRPEPAPIARILTPASPGEFAISPAGPYAAGQAVRVAITLTEPARLDDPTEKTIGVCYPWDGGETCDPTIRSQYVSHNATTATYNLNLPGWVNTPTGLQPCDTLGCRLEFANSDGTRTGSARVVIVSGPKPEAIASLNGIHRDEALLSVSVDNLEPDSSWTRWSATVTPAAAAAFPPGNLSICAFAERLLCDGLVQHNSPAFDSKPQLLTLATNRLLLTSSGWIDCVEVVCVIAISRSIGVQGGEQTVGSDTETIALVPYRLPATTPEMRRPTLTMEPSAALHAGDIVTATLHDPPRYVDPASRLLLSQCSTADPRDFCPWRVADDATQTQSWSTLPDGSLRQQVPLSACDVPAGCFLAIQPTVKGHPQIARTDRFPISP